MTVIPYLHASCVEKDGRGILLRGHSGAGKSSFALSLINRGFKLVADDQVRTVVENGCLVAQAASALKGLLEVRGVGIIKLDYSPSCHVQYLIDLVPGFRSDRMPPMVQTSINSILVRSFQMNPMDSKSIEKVLILFHQDFLSFYEEDQNGEITSKSATPGSC
jgi:HPr kinase/phosphorylase